MVCCKEWTKSLNFRQFLVSSLSSNFSGTQGVSEVKQFVIIIDSVTSQVSEKKVFQGSFWLFSECSLSSNHLRVNFFFWALQSFFTLSRQFCAPVRPSFLWLIFFCKQSCKRFKSLLGLFFSQLFCINALSNKSWWTSNCFSPLLRFASLSTYAIFIQQNSNLDSANAFVLLILRVAREESV